MSCRTWLVAGGTAMSPSAAQLDEERLARATLTYLAEPGDPALGALLAICEPAEVLAAIQAGTLPRISEVSRAALERALGRWQSRLPKLPAGAGSAAARRNGIRVVC